MGTSQLKRSGLVRLAAADEMLRAVEEISLPLAQALIAVAREPGLSVNQLAERLNVPQQTASRYVATLSGRYQVNGSTVDFVRTPLLSLEVSAHDPRSRAVFLTDHGEKRLTLILGETTDG